MRGDERSFPGKVICLERLDDTVLPPKEAFFGRLKNEGISDEDFFSCQEAWCNNGMTTLRDFLVWYNNRDVDPFLQAIDRQFAFYQQRGIYMFKQCISVPGLTLLYILLTSLLELRSFFTAITRKGSPRYVRTSTAARPCRSIVGYDANALYLWSLMQDMPMGWYTRRREENDFRPESVQLYGQMAAEWLTWESERTGRSIRHQINGREKRIGNLPVDGWCSETNTAYQFHGCFFHGHSCTGKEVNAINGKPMTQLLAERPERTPPSHQILNDVRIGTVFGLIECDVCVPEALREHFAEMQPVFKNIRLTRDDLGPFMRRYAEEYNIDSEAHARGQLSRRQDLATIRFRASDGSVMQCPRVTETPSPTWTDIVTSTIVQRRRHRSWSTTDGSDNSTLSLTMHTR